MTQVMSTYFHMLLQTAFFQCWILPGIFFKTQDNYCCILKAIAITKIHIF